MGAEFAASAALAALNGGERKTPLGAVAGAAAITMLATLYPRLLYSRSRVGSGALKTRSSPNRSSGNAPVYAAEVTSAPLFSPCV